MVDEENPVYDSRHNCNAIIETARNVLLSGCSATEIPVGVEGLGAYAFCGLEELTSMVIPKGVKRVEECAFSGCYNLESVNIPVGVTRIEYGTFEYCSSLTSITIPESVTEIGGYAFN